MMTALFEITNHPPGGAMVAIDAKGVTYDGKSELIPLRK